MMCVYSIEFMKVSELEELSAKDRANEVWRGKFGGKLSDGRFRYLLGVQRYFPISPRYSYPFLRPTFPLPRDRLILVPPLSLTNGR